MARKRILQPTFQGSQSNQGLKKCAVQQKLPLRSSANRKMSQSSLNKNNHTIEDNEVEVISDEELPSEDQPEDGELSEISDVEIEASNVQHKVTIEEGINKITMPVLSTLRNDDGKNNQSRCSSDCYTNDTYKPNKKGLGKFISRSTPSSPEHAHNVNIHSDVSRYQNIPSHNEKPPVVNNSASILNDKVFVDDISRICSDKSSVAQIKYCDSAGDVDILEDAEMENQKEDGEIDDIEEWDEDLLYLRLMALRSIELKAEGSKANNECILIDEKQPHKDANSKEIQCIDVEDMVDEMEDLLNEADQAAYVNVQTADLDQNNDCIEIIDREIPVIPIIDIPDSDEEQIDLELERWTKSRTISISNLDTNASFQPQAGAYNPSMVLFSNNTEPNLPYKDVDKEPDYTQLVQRLRQTLERQNQQKELKKEKDIELIYSPSQSPIKEVLDTRCHEMMAIDQNGHNSKYSPTQSPLSDFIDTPIGSAGSTPRDLTPPDITIPLQITLNNKRFGIKAPPINDNDLPPLPPGSPCKYPLNDHPVLNESDEISKISLPPENNAKSSPLVSERPRLQNNSRSITPPPPGDENSSFEINNYRKSKDSVNSTVDMDLDSDNEAEIQFFKDQQEEIRNNSEWFPTSAWNFSNYNAWQQFFKSLTKSCKRISLSAQDV